MRFFLYFCYFKTLSFSHTIFFFFLVLSHGEDQLPNVTSQAAIERVAAYCGAEFCPNFDASSPHIPPPPDRSKINLLSAIFFALMIVACLLVAFFVDPLKRYEMGRKGSGSELNGIRLLAVTLRQLMQIKQILLLPITMFIGAEQAFIAADFTSVIMCSFSVLLFSFFFSFSLILSKILRFYFFSIYYLLFL